MRTRLVLAVLPVAIVGAVALPSSAAPAKEVKGTFDATGTPDPSADAFETCQGLIPTSRFEVPVKIPSAGKLAVKVNGFQGDWDLALESKDGKALATSGNLPGVPEEAVSVKFKKATEVVIVACNFAGGPTAAGSWVFTPAAKK